MSNITYVQFFRGEINHPRGFSINEIIEWDGDEWENNHDFIQWVFPTYKRSKFNENVPLLTNKEVKIFRSDKELQNVINEVWERFSEFLEIENNSSPSWFHDGNHNLFRVTRAIDSLKTLSTDNQAFRLLNHVRFLNKNNPGAISSDTMRFWEEAII